MSRIIKEFSLSLIVGFVSFFLLTFFFFPIKYAPPEGCPHPFWDYVFVSCKELFFLKAIITVIFVLFALFVYEMRLKKKENPSK